MVANDNRPLDRRSRRSVAPSRVRTAGRPFLRSLADAAFVAYRHTLRGEGSSFAGNEEGKMSFLAVITVLGLAFLIGLVGNAGHVATQKIEMQNAADAAAYSSAQVMARGMNTVTASNHSIGEVTALTVVHEALGGPQLDFRGDYQPEESDVSRTYNDILKELPSYAPIGQYTFNIYSEKSFNEFDSKVIQKLVDKMIEDDARHTAGATIFDSQITLKRKAVESLALKAVANLGFLVPPPWGYATAAAAYGVHIIQTALVAAYLKEWFLLQAIEEYAAKFAFVKKNSIQGEFIPLLHRKSLDVSREGGLLEEELERERLALEGVYKSNIALFPPPNDAKLPVVPEPQVKPGAPVPPEDSDTLETSLDAIRSAMSKMSLDIGGANDEFQNSADDMKSLKKTLEDERAELDEADSENEMKDEEEALKEIDSEAEAPEDLSAEEKEQLAEELKEREQNRKERREDKEKEILRRERLDKYDDIDSALAGVESEAKEIDKRIEDMEKANAKQEELQSFIGGLSDASDSNPSVDHFPTNDFDFLSEQRTQWMRATWPHVDAYSQAVRKKFDGGGGLLANFEANLQHAEAAKHMEKWVRRYAVINAWMFRSGYRPKANGSRIVWNKSAKPMRMLAMVESYDRGDDRKGQERWSIGRSSGDRRVAEKLFTTFAIAGREGGALFSPKFYDDPNDFTLVTFAQGICYDANPQVPTASAQRQRNLGWDTLNWKPPVEAPEYSHEGTAQREVWPWEVNLSREVSRTQAVHLNWQAKLVPATESRMRDMMNSSELPGGADRSLEPLKGRFDDVVTH